jgi:hypothetical protein
MQSDDLESKQQFLRDEILEAGFDPDHFTLWIDKEKIKGCELDEWDMKELVQAVGEYKQSHSQVKTSSKGQSPSSPERSSCYGSEPFECSSVHSNSIPVDPSH